MTDRLTNFSYMVDDHSMQNIDSTPDAPQVKKRRPWLAVLLSFLTPGLGHVYAGRPLKGLVLFALIYVSIVVGFFVDYSSFAGYVALVVCWIGYVVYFLVSAYRLAKKGENYQLKKYNRWYIYVAIFLVGTLLLSVFSQPGLNLLGVRSYRIVSKSMAPTLQLKDLITVNTRYTDIKIGDIVVFAYPKNKEVDYTFRVAALGGDTIAIDEGVVIVNGEPALELALKPKANPNGHTL